MVSLLFVFLIMLLLLILLFFLSYSYAGSALDKGSSFECGFNSFLGSMVPFSMPFFLVSLMFLLFDVEILLVCFIPLLKSFFYYNISVGILVVFMIFISTAYEWLKGILMWI